MDPIVVDFLHNNLYDLMRNKRQDKQAKKVIEATNRYLDKPNTTNTRTLEEVTKIYLRGN